ncbi:hypothetical protein MRB53_038995 [Persea americana]|nr:hypothetical protein MRB53_038995 [Persea americana]
MRPAELQYHENDFLDEEPSGDENWNGRRSASAEARPTYAWEGQNHLRLFVQSCWFAVCVHCPKRLERGYDATRAPNARRIDVMDAGESGHEHSKIEFLLSRRHDHAVRSTCLSRNLRMVDDSFARPGSPPLKKKRCMVWPTKQQCLDRKHQVRRDKEPCLDLTLGGLVSTRHGDKIIGPVPEGKLRRCAALITVDLVVQAAQHSQGRSRPHRKISTQSRAVWTVTATRDDSKSYFVAIGSDSEPLEPSFHFNIASSLRNAGFAASPADLAELTISTRIAVETYHPAPSDLILSVSALKAPPDGLELLRGGAEVISRLARVIDLYPQPFPQQPRYESPTTAYSQLENRVENAPFNIVVDVSWARTITTLSLLASIQQSQHVKPIEHESFSLRLVDPDETDETVFFQPWRCPICQRHEKFTTQSFLYHCKTKHKDLSINPDPDNALGFILARRFASTEEGAELAASDDDAEPTPALTEADDSIDSVFGDPSIPNAILDSDLEASECAETSREVITRELDARDVKDIRPGFVKSTTNGLHKTNSTTLPLHTKTQVRKQSNPFRTDKGGAERQPKARPEARVDAVITTKEIDNHEEQSTTAKIDAATPGQQDDQPSPAKKARYHSPPSPAVVVTQGQFRSLPQSSLTRYATNGASTTANSAITTVDTSVTSDQDSDMARRRPAKATKRAPAPGPGTRRVTDVPSANSRFSSPQTQTAATPSKEDKASGPDAITMRAVEEIPSRKVHRASKQALQTPRTPRLASPAVSKSSAPSKMLPSDAAAKVIQPQEKAKVSRETNKPAVLLSERDLTPGISTPSKTTLLQPAPAKPMAVKSTAVKQTPTKSVSVHQVVKSASPVKAAVRVASPQPIVTVQRSLTPAAEVTAMRSGSLFSADSTPLRTTPRRSASAANKASASASPSKKVRVSKATIIVPPLPSARRPRFPVPAANPPTTFFRTESKRAMVVGELLSESEDDIDESWLRLRHRDIIEANDEITSLEKNFLKKWDDYMIKESLSGDRYVPDAMLRFCDKHKYTLRNKDIQRVFVRWAVELEEMGVVQGDMIVRCLEVIDSAAVIKKLDDAVGRHKPVTDCVCGRNVLDPRELVICDDAMCKNPRYHMSCVGLRARPSSWLCRSCKDGGES